MQVELALTEDLPCILYIFQLASPLALDSDVFWIMMCSVSNLLVFCSFK